MTMMGIAEAARALDAGIRGVDVAFDGVNTDSRAIRRGDLFVALKGERFDGHRFVAQAAAAGAVAAMVQDPGSGIQDPEIKLPLIVVRDTRLALGRPDIARGGGRRIPDAEFGILRSRHARQSQ
jgi:UDP-N-acetylmuramoyl-tripeptide--D-alanyl-D-alanine ligase